MEGLFGPVEVVIQMADVPLQGFHAAAEREQVARRVPQDPADVRHHLLLLLLDLLDSAEYLRNVKMELICLSVLGPRRSRP